MSEMAERVARAIVFAERLNPDDIVYGCINYGYGPVATNARLWQFALPVAKAAIAAMREPTEAMIAATEELLWDGYSFGPGEARVCWSGMIDEALK